MAANIGGAVLSSGAPRIARRRDLVRVVEWILLQRAEQLEGLTGAVRLLLA